MPEPDPKIIRLVAETSPPEEDSRGPAELVREAIEGGDLQAIMQGLSRIQHQADLEAIARQCPHWEVRRYVLTRSLEDRRTAVRIGLKDPSPDVRNAMVSLLDQEQLAQIALVHPETLVRSRAAEAIEDQDLLQRLLRTSKDAMVLLAALDKMQDNGVLRDLAVRTQDLYVAKAALRRVTAKTDLRLVASTASSVASRLEALKRLGTSVRPLEFLHEQAPLEVCRYLIKRLPTVEVRQLAWDHSGNTVRLAAVEELDHRCYGDKEVEQELVRLVKVRPSADIVRFLMSRATVWRSDPAHLALYVLDTSADRAQRIEAIKIIKSRQILEELAGRIAACQDPRNDVQVRRALLVRLLREGIAAPSALRNQTGPIDLERDLGSRICPRCYHAEEEPFISDVDHCGSCPSCLYYSSHPMITWE